MKITIDIECTPSEARDLMGLPDVQKLQEQWLTKVQDRIMDEADKFSAEKILNSWAAGAASNTDMFTNMMAAFMPGGKTKG